MQFFVPQFPETQHEQAYASFLEVVKDQMRTKVTDRRIHSIKYVHDRKRYTARVGEPDPQQGRFEVLAIFESTPFAVISRTRSGKDSVMILVNSAEIEEVEEFASA
jgi:hypothetical protein